MSAPTKSGRCFLAKLEDHPLVNIVIFKKLLKESLIGGYIVRGHERVHTVKTLKLNQDRHTDTGPGRVKRVKIIVSHSWTSV